MVIGSYTYKNSFIHHLDPRSKLLFLLVFSFVTFTSSKAIEVLLLFLVVILLLFLSKLSRIKTVKSILPLTPFIFFIFLVQTLTNQEGFVLFEIFNIEVYSVGIKTASLYIFKLITILIIATIITNSTNPMHLTEAIKFFMRPLGKIGFPVKNISMSMTIAITFIPIIFEEAKRIRTSQKIRNNNNAKFYILLVSLIMPLIFNTMDRAEKLALTMHLRGYNERSDTISIKYLSWQLHDTLFLFLFLSYTIMIKFL